MEKVDVVYLEAQNSCNDIVDFIDYFCNVAESSAFENRKSARLHHIDFWRR